MPRELARARAFPKSGPASRTRYNQSGARPRLGTRGDPKPGRPIEVTAGRGPSPEGFLAAPAVPDGRTRARRLRQVRLPGRDSSFFKMTQQDTSGERPSEGTDFGFQGDPVGSESNAARGSQRDRGPAAFPELSGDSGGASAPVTPSRARWGSGGSDRHARAAAAPSWGTRALSAARARSSSRATRPAIRATPIRATPSPGDANPRRRRIRGSEPRPDRAAAGIAIAPMAARKASRAAAQPTRWPPAKAKAGAASAAGDAGAAEGAPMSRATCACRPRPRAMARPPR